jgi:hypothetical protein
MATRMQQRRGTAAQWTAANPILAAGEIGFETDTSKFKMGNGSSAWTALTYFANAAELAAIIDGAPALLNTLDELALALGDDPQFLTTIATNLSTHAADTTNVHGIVDTNTLATLTNVDGAIQAAAGALSTHAADTTAIHGIADTSLLATTTNVDAAIQAASGALSTHAADTTAIHGIADTSLLATTADITTHNSDTSNVHGIVDTTVLVTQTQLTDAVSGAEVNQSLLAGVGIDWNGTTEAFDIDSTVATKTYADTAVSTHNSDTTDVHGIADTSLLATKSYADTAEADAITAAGTAADTKISTAVAALTKSSVGLANVDNTSDANKPVSTATQTALDLKAPKATPTFTGTVTASNDLVVDGNLTVNGTTFNASSTSITIEDNMVQLAHQNAGNAVDLGLVVAYNDGAAKHAGLVRDVSDAKWKLFQGVTTEPTTTVNFGQGSLDNLAVAALEATTVTASSGVVFSDGTQTKEGVQSRTPIVQKTASYTLSALTERDSLIEMGSGSALTLTVPSNATVAWPVGTSIDILQTGAGQVTIAAGAGVTVNGTPGLKLRTQWSGVTLFKRATDTWVVYGDLTA